MIGRTTLALLLVAALCHAQATTPSPMLANLRLQIALERECFSPGVLDGRTGPKTALALAEFQRVRGLPATGKLDESTAATLRLTTDSPLTSHVITAGDLAKVTGPTPKSWVAKSKLKSLGYANPTEALCERFHCSEALLVSLNPKRSLASLKAGDTITVPNLPAPTYPRATRIEINLTQKVMRAYDANNQLVGLFHCSIAKDKEKRPSGSAYVQSIARDPVYRWDPKMWPEVKGINQVLMIPPGPNNPVGLCWMGLSLKGYGMHGSPTPELIGKTGSHGCFRLTNWDALRMSSMIRTGTPVKFVN